MNAFPDAPVMLRIAKAESGLKGLPCANKTNKTSSARGCFQILKSTWTNYKCKGDVMNDDDNIACARIIYDRDGTVPWNESKATWSK